MFTGVSGAGKSSLCAALLGHEQPVRKTQAPVYHGPDIVDIPGEYLTHPRQRQAFLACAEEVEGLVVLFPATLHSLPFPADLLGAARGTKLVGVVSKIDLPGANPVAARGELARLGIREPVFETSVAWPETIEALRSRLQELGLW